MEMKTIDKSSNINSIGYEGSSKELVIEFKGGKTYFYADVEQKMVDRFMLSESKGKFFHQNILGKYEFKRNV